MSLPFTVEQFFAVFAAYNAAIWPAQLVAYGLGLAAVAALWRPQPTGMRIVFAVLAVFWAWTGLAYHLMQFSAINPAARLFALMFVAQAILFAAAAASAGIRFELRPSLRSVLAFALIVYALAVYEALGALAGHGFMKGPLFGVAPCPTTIFTLGVLMLARGRWVPWLAVIPVLWALVGSTAALLLAVPEDLGLAAAAAALLGALALGRTRPAPDRRAG